MFVWLQMLQHVYWVGPDFIGLQTTSHYSMGSSCENMGLPWLALPGYEPQTHVFLGGTLTKNQQRPWVTGMSAPELVENLQETAIFGDALRLKNIWFQPYLMAHFT